MAIRTVCIYDIYVGELQTSKGCFCAFDEMFATETEIVDLIPWGGKGGVVGAPVDLGDC